MIYPNDHIDDLEWCVAHATAGAIDEAELIAELESEIADWKAAASPAPEPPPETP